MMNFKPLVGVLTAALVFSAASPIARADGQSDQVALLKELTQGLLKNSPDGQFVVRRFAYEHVCAPKMDGWRAEWATSPEKARFDATIQNEMRKKLAMPGVAALVDEERGLLRRFIDAWKQQLTADDLAHMSRAAALVAQHKRYTVEEANYSDYMEQRLKKFSDEFFRNRSRYSSECRGGDWRDGDACVHDPGFFYHNQVYMPQVDTLAGSSYARDTVGDDEFMMSDDRHKILGVSLDSRKSAKGFGSSLNVNTVGLSIYPSIDEAGLADDWRFLESYGPEYPGISAYETVGYRAYERGESLEGYLSQRFSACVEQATKNVDLSTLLSSAEDKTGGVKTVAPTGSSAPTPAVGRNGQVAAQ